METFISEMKRYAGFTDRDAHLLHSVAGRMEKYVPALLDRFYLQIRSHPDAFKVFASSLPRTKRLNFTLQAWLRGLFSGDYGDRYARQREQLGHQLVHIGLEQKYLIGTIAMVRGQLTEAMRMEFPASDERVEYVNALNRVIDLDLNLMCSAYFHQSVDNLRVLNQQLEGTMTELAEANATKDEFLAHISHELRTPLNSILGFTKLVLDGMCTSRDEERDVLRDVFDSAQLLLRIVNDLLDISRVDAGKLSLHLDDIPLRSLLDSTLPLIVVQAAAKNIPVLDETLEVELPVVRSDEVRFRQVLLNVLTNAVKFTDEGAISIRGFEMVDGKSFCLEIEDTGMGVPAAERERIFDRFVRGNSRVAARIEGAGLGLAIAKKMIEMMGGKIGMDSGKRGRGSLVWFTIPIAPRQESIPAVEGEEVREGA